MEVAYIKRPQLPITDIAFELDKVDPWQDLKKEHATLQNCILYVKEVAEDGEVVLKAWHCNAKRCVAYHGGCCPCLTKHASRQDLIWGHLRLV
jgi:hypothetical protein